MAGSSSSNPGEEYHYQYPYPPNVFVPSFVSVKLSGREMYGVWQTQMLCLLKSHGMLGFINGTLERPRNSVLGKERMGDYMLWERSDALVQGWILGSLSEQTLKRVVNLLNTNEDFTAKDVWDKLQTIYGPPAPLLQQPATDLDNKEEEEKTIIEDNSIFEDAKLDDEGAKEDELSEEEKRKKTAKKKKEAEERAEALDSLYEATLGQRYESVDFILRNRNVLITDKITINGNTALHVAVGTTKNTKFVERMLERADASTLCDMRNSEGSTLLHVAAIVGNTKAAKILVEKNRDLLFAKDKEGYTPLARALSNMHTNTYLYLLNPTNTPDIEMGTLFADSALALSEHYTNFQSDSVLMAIAQNFPLKLNIWERTANEWLNDPEQISLTVIAMFWIASIIFFKIKSKRFHGWMLLVLWLEIAVLSFTTLAIYKFLQLIIRKLEILLCVYVAALQFNFFKGRAQMHREATYLLKSICSSIKGSVDSHSHRYYYTNAILEATRQNAYEVVVMIVSCFPNAIWSANEDGHNIIQYAVINRSEEVYNLLYQMSEHKNIYRTIKDPFGNNLLHLAGRLAPTNKLNLISGAALKLQRELQWFKEVERFVCPLNIIQKNSFEETPEMVFTREHKELVIEGEKWMRATAESYTITAALITTIVFAAAITVPGGNNQDTGIPVFSNKNAFTIFAISDAISLFTSTTSLLMFLSILTTRFAEQDFLFKLPTKLIIGLATLFISTTAMIVAFGATLLLVFGQRESWILIPIAALTCLPITSFVTLQFPLIADLTSATYGRSIFGKKSDHPFY